MASFEEERCWRALEMAAKNADIATPATRR